MVATSSPSSDSRLEAAYGLLRVVDPILATLVDEVGRPDPFDWPGAQSCSEDLFASLVLHVIGQQISMAAALAIFGRLVTRTGPAPLDPSRVADLRPEGLRTLGLSGAKSRAIHELAAALTRGDLDLDALHHDDDATATAKLTSLRGIGPWSAHMFLIHQLQRPDVFPEGDVGLQRAVHEAWSLKTRPTRQDLATRAEAWAPFRSYAAALLWSSLHRPWVTPPEAQSGDALPPLDA